MMEHKMWTVEMKGDQFVFTKFVDGHQVISHAPVDKAMATVIAVSIIHGFQPPVLFSEVENG